VTTENSYEVDDETKELLSALMNYMEMFSDAQVDQETAYELRLLNQELGKKFGITLTEIDIEESVDAEGNLNITLKKNREQDGKPGSDAKAKASHLRLVKPEETSSSVDAEQLDTLDTE
tara:strand:- start:109 stop:465 length:357 start_codon:yes stop_codon:yes gene_type:complete